MRSVDKLQERGCRRVGGHGSYLGKKAGGRGGVEEGESCRSQLDDGRLVGIFRRSSAVEQMFPFPKLVGSFFKRKRRGRLIGCRIL